MAITINIYYRGKNGNAVKFVQEMLSSGVVEKIRGKKGNIRYDYFLPFENRDCVLLIDSWQDKTALENHHKSPLMEKISMLREKYDLHMEVERFVSDETKLSDTDIKFIRK